MDKLLVSGFTSAQLRRMAARGEIFKVAQRLYCWRKPSPEELARLLPTGALTGESARQLLLNQELTFPLHVAVNSSIPTSELYRAVRRRNLRWRHQAGIRYQLPIQAAEFVDHPQDFLEQYYAGPRGKFQLDQDLAAGRIPKKVRTALEKASIGSDSVPERIVVRALRSAGFTVRTNVLIGEYRWDIYIPRLRLLIEIDGFEYHRERGPFIKDRWKSNDATARGYKVLRYSGSCVRHHLTEVVDQVKTLRTPMKNRRFLTGAWHWHAILNGFA